MFVGGGGGGSFLISRTPSLDPPEQNMGNLTLDFVEPRSTGSTPKGEMFNTWVEGAPGEIPVITSWLVTGPVFSSHYSNARSILLN